MFSIDLHNKFYYYLFCALAFCIPFYRILSVIIIGLIILNWLLEARFVKKYRTVTKSLHRKETLLFGVLYLGYVIGLTYTSNITDGLFSLQMKLPLIIFPILFATIDLDYWNNQRIRTLLISFIAGCFVASLYCLLNAGGYYLITQNVEEFYFGDLSEFHHPSYFAMYISFAIAVLIWFLLEIDFTGDKWYKVVVLFMIIYFSVFVIMLSSKAGVLILAIVFILSISYLILVKRKYITGIGLTIIITLLFTLALKVLPYPMMRFDYAMSILQNDDEFTNEATEGTAKRVLVWKHSIEIIKKHFFFGVGTGDVMDTLLELYEEKSLNDILARKINTHNQYIQTFIALGVIGFLLLLFSLALPLICCLRRKSFIYSCFITIVGLNLLVEAMLERQAGVVFYAFFNAVLFALLHVPKSLEKA